MFCIFNSVQRYKPLNKQIGSTWTRVNNSIINPLSIINGLTATIKLNQSTG
uniref:Uncharacterized protein n=1 Tax=Rhizophora mucronata TaxID=61149 RepID=A0A2P2N4X8_RHIMU